jgi:hypothetical protein
MRYVFLFFLLLFLAAIGYFAWENRDVVTIKLLGRDFAYPNWMVIGAAYLLGMFSGWSVVGFVKRSWKRVTQESKS